MTVLLDNVSVDTEGPFIAGEGSERQILVTADDFGTGSVKFQLSRTVTDSPVAFATDLNGTVLDINSNRAVNIGPIPVGLQLRAKLSGTDAATSEVRADIF